MSSFIRPEQFNKGHFGILYNKRPCKDTDKITIDKNNYSCLIKVRQTKDERGMLFIFSASKKQECTTTNNVACINSNCTEAVFCCNSHLCNNTKYFKLVFAVLFPPGIKRHPVYDNRYSGFTCNKCNITKQHKKKKICVVSVLNDMRKITPKCVPNTTEATVLTTTNQNTIQAPTNITRNATALTTTNTYNNNTNSSLSFSVQLTNSKYLLGCIMVIYENINNLLINY